MNRSFRWIKMAHRGCWGITFDSFPRGGFQLHLYTPVMAVGMGINGTAFDRSTLCPILSTGCDFMVSIDSIPYDGQGGLYLKHWYFPYFVVLGERP